MITDKDWFIEYVAHTDAQPTEDNLREYVERLIEQAEQNYGQDW